MSQTVIFIMTQSFKTGLALQNRQSIALNMIFVPSKKVVHSSKSLSDLVHYYIVLSPSYLNFV